MANEPLDEQLKLYLDMKAVEIRKATPAEPARLGVELWYPPKDPAEEPTKIAAIEVGLQHVRAADSILVSYDFERDGWVIKQASKFRWEMGDEVCDPDWQEVAFIQAWAREVDHPEST